MAGMEIVYTENEVYGRLGVSGMTLEKAAKLIVKKYGIANKKEETKEANPMPYHVQY